MSVTAPVPCPVSGPPLAWTPVYKVLSSWNLFASALVPVRVLPPEPRMVASSYSLVSPLLAAHCSTAASNCAKSIFRADLSFTLANMRSMSVLLHFLLIIPQSFANFANVLPSISLAPAENYAKTSFREPAPPLTAATCSCFGALAAAFFAGAFFSSSSTTPAT